MMRNCPHCQFLLTTDSDTCAVCNLPVEQPPPVPAGLVAAMAPTEAAGGGSTPSAGGTPPAWSVPGGTAPPTAPPAPGFSTPGSIPPGPAAPGSPSSGFSVPGATPPWAPPPTGPASGPADPAGFQVAPVATKGKGRVVVAVVLGLVGLVLVALVGLTFIGTTTESADIDVATTDWTSYSDPRGAFTVEMPGEIRSIADLSEESGVDDLGIEVRGVVGEDESFGAAVFRYGLPPGAAFDLNAGVDGGAASAFKDSTVTDRVPIETPWGPGVDAKVVGTLNDGAEGAAFIRLITADGVPYMMVTSGPASASAESAQLQERMVNSFRAHSAP